MKGLNVFVCVCECTQSFPTLCDPRDCSPPRSSVHGSLQARILEWAAVSFPGDLPHPGMEPASPASLALVGEFFKVAPGCTGTKHCRGGRDSRGKPARSRGCNSVSLHVSYAKDGASSEQNKHPKVTVFFSTYL